MRAGITFLLAGCLMISGGLVQGGTHQPVLANGVAGQLTEDAFEAYFEALVFCLGEIGQRDQFSASDKQQMKQSLAEAFPSLAPETQLALTNARETWNQYRASWSFLDLDEKKAFAFDVLALAYGEAAAAQALGLSADHGAHSTSGGFSVDVPVTEESMKAYSGGIDAGDGTYEFETYDYSTGDYSVTYE